MAISKRELRAKMGSQNFDALFFEAAEVKTANLSDDDLTVLCANLVYAMVDHDGERWVKTLTDMLACGITQVSDNVAHADSVTAGAIKRLKNTIKSAAA